MTIEYEFNQWFQKQIDDCLIDFKADVRSAPEGTNKEEAMADILKYEKLRSSGEVEESLPLPDQPCLAGQAYNLPVDEEFTEHIEKCEKFGYTKKYCDY